MVEPLPVLTGWFREKRGEWIQFGSERVDPCRFRESGMGVDPCRFRSERVDPCRFRESGMGVDPCRFRFSEQRVNQEEEKYHPLALGSASLVPHFINKSKTKNQRSRTRTNDPQPLRPTSGTTPKRDLRFPL
jgi:hypothetical protein